MYRYETRLGCMSSKQQNKQQRSIIVAKIWIWGVYRWDIGGYEINQAETAA